MTHRSALAAAAFVAGLGAPATTAQAGDAQTFEAWGHTFVRPEAQPPRRDAVRADLAMSSRHTYASAPAPAPAEGSVADALVARTRPGRILNVWGARIEAPTD